jgi:hypothetical protein
MKSANPKEFYQTLNFLFDDRNLKILEENFKSVKTTPKTINRLRNYEICVSERGNDYGQRCNLIICASCNSLNNHLYIKEAKDHFIISESSKGLFKARPAYAFSVGINVDLDLAEKNGIGTAVTAINKVISAAAGNFAGYLCKFEFDLSRYDDCIYVHAHVIASDLFCRTGRDETAAIVYMNRKKKGRGKNLDDYPFGIPDSKIESRMDEIRNVILKAIQKQPDKPFNTDIKITRLNPKTLFPEPKTALIKSPNIFLKKTGIFHQKDMGGENIRMAFDYLKKANVRKAYRILEEMENPTESDLVREFKKISNLQTDDKTWCRYLIALLQGAYKTRTLKRCGIYAAKGSNSALKKLNNHFEKARLSVEADMPEIAGLISVHKPPPAEITLRKPAQPKKAANAAPAVLPKPPIMPDIRNQPPLTEIPVIGFLKPPSF